MTQLVGIDRGELFLTIKRKDTCGGHRNRSSNGCRFSEALCGEAPGRTYIFQKGYAILGLQDYLLLWFQVKCEFIRILAKFSLGMLINGKASSFISS